MMRDDGRHTYLVNTTVGREGRASSWLVGRFAMDGLSCQGADCGMGPNVIGLGATTIDFCYIVCRVYVYVCLAGWL